MAEVIRLAHLLEYHKLVILICCGVGPCHLEVSSLALGPNKFNDYRNLTIIYFIGAYATLLTTCQLLLDLCAVIVYRKMVRVGIGLVF